MLLSSSAQDEANAAYAEKILIDLSAAFDHTFSMRQGKIGEKSKAASGESLTDKTIDACQSCQAVFVCDAGADGIEDLYDALNLPLLVRVTEEAIRTVPKSYREASLALGATKLQTITRVILPKALPGILTGITLTAGRALGETAILIFTAGTTVSRHRFDFDVMAGGETLAVHLWYLMSTGLVPDRDIIADGIGALLLLIILAFNMVLLLSVRFWQRRAG